MPHDNVINVVLCWHMHQPEYRNLLTGEFQLPWTYLHAIKDYVDMAAHLESEPQARAVVNFTPLLLEQLTAYAKQLSEHLSGHGVIHDPLLAALDTPVFPADLEHRLALVQSCLKANRKNLIERFPAFHRLADIAELVSSEVNATSYLSNQYLADLVTWYHLAWLGETVRRSNPAVQKLLDQGTAFQLPQRRELLQVIAELLAELPKRYRALADRGQIELSMSPYAHPMLPLLLDFSDARDALPDLELPHSTFYPGGAARVEWHLQHGLQVFEDYFKRKPVGCWPPEGGVSRAALAVIANRGFQWAATGETVLRNSLADHVHGLEDHHISVCKPYQLAPTDLVLFGRHDELSDLIGFTYSDWHADDAVEDLVSRLEAIADLSQEEPKTVVPIILDGENPWEYYPDNAFHFIPAMYRRLSDHPRFNLVTFADVSEGEHNAELTGIVSGSWVYGTFSTWIGSHEKNRAWDYLVEVKQAYDRIVARGGLSPQLRTEIDRQLAICEGSDWFWWFGDYNPAETVRDFERLYRLHLSNLYELLDLPPPNYLTKTLAHGQGSPDKGGVIRPASC